MIDIVSKGKIFSTKISAKDIFKNRNSKSFDILCVEGEVCHIAYNHQLLPIAFSNALSNILSNGYDSYHAQLKGEGFINPSFLEISFVEDKAEIFKITKGEESDCVEIIPEIQSIENLCKTISDYVNEYNIQLLFIYGLDNSLIKFETKQQFDKFAHDKNILLFLGWEIPNKESPSTFNETFRKKLKIDCKLLWYNEQMELVQFIYNSGGKQCIYILKNGKLEAEAQVTWAFIFITILPTLPRVSDLRNKKRSTNKKDIVTAIHGIFKGEVTKNCIHDHIREARKMKIIEYKSKSYYPDIKLVDNAKELLSDYIKKNL